MIGIVIELSLISQSDVIVMLVLVCLCVRSPISHHNKVQCGLIVTKRYMEIAGCDICIVEKYHGVGQRSRSNSPKT